MQIACPACTLVYAVADDAIPADIGREVACTACGLVWIARPPGPRPALRPPPNPFEYEADELVFKTPDPEVRAEPTKPPPPRRKVDPEALAILRSEAEFERAARRAAGLAPDVGAAPSSLSRLRAAASAAGAPALPDAAEIEDARAALRDQLSAERSSPRLPVQTAPRLPATVVATKARRRGFRAGFTLTGGLCAAALAAYLAAPWLTGNLSAPAADWARLLEHHGAVVQTHLADWARTTLTGAPAAEGNLQPPE